MASRIFIIRSSQARFETILIAPFPRAKQLHNYLKLSDAFISKATWNVRLIIFGQLQGQAARLIAFNIYRHICRWLCSRHKSLAPKKGTQSKRVKCFYPGCSIWWQPGSRNELRWMYKFMSIDEGLRINRISRVFWLLQCCCIVWWMMFVIIDWLCPIQSERTNSLGSET